MLLPAHATKLERALDIVVRELLDVETSVIRALRRPEICDPAWLPWLAWERHVDAWRGDWDPEVRRAAVLGSFERHAIAGTPAGDRLILAEAGAVAEVTERPGGAHHEVAIRILNSQDLVLSVADIARALKDVGRASVHYTLTAAAGLAAELSTGKGIAARSTLVFSMADAAEAAIVLRPTTAMLAATGTVELRRLALGSGSGPGGAADDGRTALRAPRDDAALAAAAEVGGSIWVGGRASAAARITATAAYNVAEVGIWGRAGMGGQDFLAAYWTDGGRAVARAGAVGNVIDARGVIGSEGITADLDIATAASAGPQGPAGESS